MGQGNFCFREQISKSRETLLASWIVSNVTVTADSIVGDRIYFVSSRSPPRVSNNIVHSGLKSRKERIWKLSWVS